MKYFVLLLAIGLLRCGSGGSSGTPVRSDSDLDPVVPVQPTRSLLRSSNRTTAFIPDAKRVAVFDPDRGTQVESYEFDGEPATVLLLPDAIGVVAVETDAVTLFAEGQQLRLPLTHATWSRFGVAGVGASLVFGRAGGLEVVATDASLAWSQLDITVAASDIVRPRWTSDGQSIWAMDESGANFWRFDRDATGAIAVEPSLTCELGQGAVSSMEVLANQVTVGLADGDILWWDETSTACPDVASLLRVSPGVTNPWRLSTGGGSLFISGNQGGFAVVGGFPASPGVNMATDHDCGTPLAAALTDAGIILPCLGLQSQTVEYEAGYSDVQLLLLDSTGQEVQVRRAVDVNNTVGAAFDDQGRLVQIFDSALGKIRVVNLAAGEDKTYTGLFIDDLFD